ncbi:hypothetical protein GCM10009087_05070 [Sphingomonas oligophenolica]
MARQIIIIDYSTARVIGRELPEERISDAEEEFEAVCNAERLRASDCSFISNVELDLDIDFTKSVSI